MKASLPVLIVSVFLSIILTNSATEKDDPASWSLKKKASMATKYQSGFKKAASAQLSKIEKSKLTPQEFGTELQKYNDITTNYVNSINAMKFPCGTTAAAKKNKGYLTWWRKFAAKDKKIMDGFFARVKKIMANPGIKQ